MSERKAQFAKQFINAIPHAGALGMELTQIGDGKAEISMPYDPKLVGDPKTGVIHGGAVRDVCAGCHKSTKKRVAEILRT